MVVTVLAWASAFVAIRGVGAHFTPAALTLGRLVVGALVLGVLQVRRSWLRPSRKDWLLLVVCGLAWFGGYNIALNAAERRLDAGTTAMLINIGPILIAGLAALVLGERIHRWLAVGAGVAVFGVALIAVATRAAGGSANRTGVLLCLAAAVAYAVGVVAQKPVLRRVPALQVTWVACTIGAVACLPALPSLAHDLAAAPESSIAGVVYLGVVPTALAFTTWAYALARTSAGRLGVTTYAVPPLVILLGWVLLGEVPAGLAVTGGAVCLLGVGLSRRRS